MREWARKIAEMIEKNYDYDPWIEEIDLEEALKEVEEEIEEIREAMKKGDDENLEEEIGDLVWTSFIVLLVAAKRGYDPERIVGKLEEKMKKRKPYIFSGFKPSLEEAVRIWREAKINRDL